MYQFKLHPDFDSAERLFGAGYAVILAIESEEPWSQGPVTARVVGVAHSLESANLTVSADMDRIAGMAQLDPPRRPALLPSSYELHVPRDGEYCCLGHEIAVEWPMHYRLVGLPLSDGRIELTPRPPCVALPSWKVQS